jgi:hypothetical protein
MLKLKNGFKSALQELESGTFGINSIRVNANNLSTLDKDDIVAKVVQAPVVSKKDIALARRIAEVSFHPKSLRQVSYSHESWAPYYGTAKVTQGFAFNTFYFNDVSYYDSNEAYEHETQVYDIDFADYDNYYDSNMPNHYIDSQASEPDPSIDNFAVGSTQPTAFETYKQYYTYISLRAGSSSSAFVRIKGQVGWKISPWCHGFSWCVLVAVGTTDTLTSFTAPIYYNQGWNY